jgi:hypothetical protein
MKKPKKAEPGISVREIVKEDFTVQGLELGTTPVTESGGE